MNKEEAQKAIEVLQAFIDGRTIEFKENVGGDQWKTAIACVFNFALNNYRVKPEPREFWFVKNANFKNGRFQITTTEPSANWEEVIKVREVLDE